MSDLFQLRGDTAANWTAENPILADREPGFDETNNQIRIGNGVDHWDDLEPLTAVLPALDDADIAPIAPNDQVGSGAGAYTFVLADMFRLVTGSNAAAGSYTIPPHSAVAFPLGAALQLYQKGAGQLTILAGAGVTLRTPHGAKTSVQYAVVTAIQVVQDIWVITGDTTA